MSTILCKTSLRPIVLWGLALAVLLLGGCGTRQTDMPQLAAPPQEPLFAESDDGVPLSPTELRILQASTSSLDRNLSTAALQDVSIQYKYFLRKARTTMERFSQRSEPFLGHARKVFRDRGMPEELAFLAIVESGYNAKAMSHAGASGAWQFMPYTGMKYGLNQDWWMDERLDPYKSVEAAADYLSKLYGDFKDWHLAIAAYNAGEGKISRALDGTGAKGFFDLVAKNHKLDDKAQLRTETKNYVPRFLAISKIMHNLSELGFAPVDLNRQSSVARVEVRPGTDLLALAQSVNMSWGEFNALNMAHKRHVTHIDRTSYVYVPQHARSAAVAAANSGRSNNGWKSYVAGKNDTWQNLSRRTGIPVASLQSSNRSLSSLRAGSKVRLPGWADMRMPAPEKVQVAEKTRKDSAKNVASASAGTGSTGTYKLQPGDNLSGVAREHDTTVKTLMAMNDIDDASKIRSGQTLRVPLKEAQQTRAQASRQGRVDERKSSASASKSEVQVVAVKAESKAEPKSQPERGPSGSLGKGSKSTGKAATPATYTVQPGDTLWGIARKHNISTQELLTMNKRDGKGPLRAGVKLLVSEQ